MVVMEIREVEIKRVGVFTLGKVTGAMSVLFGLIVGAILTLIALFGGVAAGAGPGGALFGIGAIILFPIFYGILGFIYGIISAVIYNLISSMIGGIVIQTEPA